MKEAAIVSTAVAGRRAAAKAQAVTVRLEKMALPTYLPAPSDKNPMFLERRVYQGSSGKVYPLPFTDRIAEKPSDRKWQAIWIENEFLRVLVLPELGGRIHAIQDKTNGYDLIYNQHVIKPALVGLAGPWVSGGIEFNWPQHHRPATFLPVDFEIEDGTDGSRTIWCGDHDPMCRMKGMHGVCLHPGKAIVELKVRACNRTPYVQTFLWWANVATRVHEAYQSFFPPDVHYVADHARRSMSGYPLAKGFYYGVNYGERGRTGIPENEIPSQFIPPRYAGKSKFQIPNSKFPSYAPNDLSFYANIPVPTSYMCMGSRGDFFGGYDFAAEAGIVHVSNHHISPGKKQWTWGNHDFGHAWDRNLTERDAQGEFGPYIEIMAGVYTDNQPDFSFLQPGETKTWSQYWYPIQKIGPAQQANGNAAISWRMFGGAGILPVNFNDPHANARIKTRRQDACATAACLGLCVTQKFSGAKIELTANGRTVWSTTRDLTPGKPFVAQIGLPENTCATDLTIRVTDDAGAEIISYQPKPRAKAEVPPPATEPPPPAEIANNDELFVTGLHLEQYRHATRCPTLYWREALRRDPLDARCNNALGLWHLKRGEFAVAETHFRNAIARLTRLNANPYDGEPFYNLGLCLRHLGHDDEAYDAFYKACWNQAWQSAGYHALAEIDCCRKLWPTALEHLDYSLRLNADNLRTRNLKAMVLRELKRVPESKALLRETLALDPLDWWARELNGERLKCDLQTALDIAHDFARAGFFLQGFLSLAVALERNEQFVEREQRESTALPTQNLGARPLAFYTIGWLLEKFGDADAAKHNYDAASKLPPDYCFPSRLEEISVLESAIRANPKDARAPCYLGNLLYDRRRHVEAIRCWENSARLAPDFSIVWRNLGIGYFNVQCKPAKARAAYDRAFKAGPADARLLFERDQLWKRLGEKPARRLRELEKYRSLVSERDDLSVELCALYNQTGQHEKALALVSSRNFQPWEGGEGGALGQWVRSHLALGRAALQLAGGARRSARAEFVADGGGVRGATHPTGEAAAHFQAALTAPWNLGEAKHLLANQSSIHFWLGCALAECGDLAKAREHWLAAAAFKGDFQEMSVRAFSEMTYYSALAWERLGKKIEARKMFMELLAYAKRLQNLRAKIDYFATSLPTMLLFDDDPQFRQETTALFLQAQARLGLRQVSRGKALLDQVLQRDPNHALAQDLLAEAFGKR